VKTSNLTPPKSIAFYTFTAIPHHLQPKDISQHGDKGPIYSGTNEENLLSCRGSHTKLLTPLLATFIIFAFTLTLTSGKNKILPNRCTNKQAEGMMVV
jgi:hypothetical protein